MLGELVLPGAQGWLLFLGIKTNYYNIQNIIIRIPLFVHKWTTNTDLLQTLGFSS